MRRRALTMVLIGFLAMVIGFPVRAQAAVLYGEWNPNWQVGDTVDNTVITAREADMSHHLDLVHWYASDTEGYASYDHIMVDNALALGRSPFVSWGLPVGFSNTAVLDDWANGIKAKAPAPVYVRLFWEFNDVPTSTNTTWGVCQSGRTPAQLVSTWQFVVNRFRADGATNVKWVWNPDGTMGSQMYGDQCGSLGAAYPGDAFVDYRGFDAYGYDVQAQYNAENAQTGSSKPMLLGEFGDSDGSGGPAWINGLSSLINNGSVPEIAAVVYFNDGSSAFASNPNTHAAVKTMLGTPAFTSGTPAPTPTPTATPTATPTPTPTATPTPTPTATPTPTPTATPTPPPAGPAFDVASGVSGGQLGPPWTVSFAANPKAGDAVIVFAGASQGSASPRVSDNAGNAYSLVKANIDQSIGEGGYLWKADAVKLPASGSLKVTLSDATGNYYSGSLGAVAYSGVAAGAPDAVAVKTGGMGGTPMTLSATATQAGDLAVETGFGSAASGSVTWTAKAPAVLRLQDSNVNAVYETSAAADLVAGAAGSVSETVTPNANAWSAEAILVLFRSA